MYKVIISATSDVNNYLSEEIVEQNEDVFRFKSTYQQTSFAAHANGLCHHTQTRLHVTKCIHNCNTPHDPPITLHDPVPI